jgi:periplasmic protein TonB
MAVRVGNTTTAGFDADVAPGDLQGFTGDGAGGGGGTRTRADQPPELLRSFQAPYPKHLIAAGIEGRVLLLVEVLPNGRAGKVTLVKGIHPELDQLAILSLQRFRWRPARRAGVKVATEIPLAFRFTIRE